MTKKQESIEGRGGSYVVGDEVKQQGTGTKNPGDPGYQEAVRKAQLQDAERKGALNRAPTYRDLDEPTQAARAQAAKRASSGAVATDTPKGGSSK